MKVTALLTGRGNNTLKDKNLLNVCGHPLLYYPAHAAKCCQLISDFYCSSDDERILDAAAEEGYQRIVRPAELGAPTAQHVDVIQHALGMIEKNTGRPDILVVTLANNVTIKPKWIEDCIEMMLIDSNISAVIPVYEDNDHHPFRAKRVGENGQLELFFDDLDENLSTNRQDLPICYFLAHNFWVLNVKKMIESGYKGQLPWGFMGENIKPYVIEESIDIHKKEDLYMAEEWVKNNWED